MIDNILINCLVLKSFRKYIRDISKTEIQEMDQYFQHHKLSDIHNFLQQMYSHTFVFDDEQKNKFMYVINTNLINDKTRGIIMDFFYNVLNNVTLQY